MLAESKHMLLAQTIFQKSFPFPCRCVSKPDYDLSLPWSESLSFSTTVPSITVQ